MSGEKAIVIHRAWEKWPDVDVELVADLVAHGWDARASQPVQVEVTEANVQRVAKVIAAETDEPGWSAVVIARAALEAALGGGDHAAE